MYALPGQLDSPHPAEGMPGSVLTGHYEFADDIIPNSLESHYKMEPQTSRDYDLPSDTGTGTSTLAYDQPSDTGTGTSTLASQYEIPVAREVCVLLANLQLHRGLHTLSFAYCNFGTGFILIHGGTQLKPQPASEPFKLASFPVSIKPVNGDWEWDCSETPGLDHSYVL